MCYDPYESRLLTGTHAALYRESLCLMLDIYQEGLREREHFDHIWVFGVQMFDELQQSQQMALLITVSNCVLNGAGDSDDWSASEKAAFYAVYRNIYQQLEMERDMRALDAASMPTPYADLEFDLDSGGFEDVEDDIYSPAGELSWREMIAKAYREKCHNEGLSDEEIDEYLATDDEEGEDLEHWDSILDSLADQILDDRDFEMAGMLMDGDPEIVDIIKKELGIKQDYFVETVSEPDTEAANRLFSELAVLAQRRGVDDAPY
ncbi:MAG: hypothetical protein KDB00_17615 [Planctomycetales bacterium]|nr:hypothetical protein [Planctomycetales bacterium]